MLTTLNPGNDLIAFLAAILFLASGFLILRHKLMGQIALAFALAGSFFVAIPYIMTSPFTAFIGAITLIGTSFYIIDFKVNTGYDKVSTPEIRALERVRYGAIVLPLLVICRLFIQTVDIVGTLSETEKSKILDAVLTVSAIIIQLIFLQCAAKQRKRYVVVIWTLLSMVFLTTLVIVFYKGYNVPIAVTILSLITLFVLPIPRVIPEHYWQWWEMFLSHPARVLLTTFMGLCIIGTVLLSLPVSAGKNGVQVLDAAFTSVSAVCVTGLVVLDTPNDFSITGQIFIILLIQLGGLGIMTITTVGLHAIGRRLSLRQERLMTTITETDHKDLIVSLVVILKFTFITEGLGTLILALIFYQRGDSLGQALWQGGFTAISAFCNAGFALQTSNLVPYQTSPLILHTVALLIILGGIAPATCLIIPRWLSGKNIPVSPYIALITTSVLLISGTLFILAFDWNGVLSGLSIIDKIHNAWFQSVTLRTAGFNSVDIAGISDSTLLVMICLMFIGGSPGGTAGGVKTTTIGILVLTFWANITNHKSVVIQNLRIQSRIIYRAITIVASGMMTWVVMVLMLEITQQIPVRDIIFEVTSAMGTVGLSTGATMHLDEIGKIIIMLTMFSGRVGPVTLFMLLSGERNDNPSRYQNAKISLT
ncbi:MAG: potassium transporter TrkH [Desulfamplus sp.]|nr:potassium transporter TrkH [Desulfamplus sp.]